MRPLSKWAELTCATEHEWPILEGRFLYSYNDTVSNLFTIFVYVTLRSSYLAVIILVAFFAFYVLKTVTGELVQEFKKLIFCSKLLGTIGTVKGAIELEINELYLKKLYL